MDAKTIKIEKEINPESVSPRIGGKSFLPQNTDWPVNPDGEHLCLIASIPLNFIEEQSSSAPSSNLFISVFSTYNKEEYFLDLITYHGDEDELENIKSGFTKVIIHEKGDPRSESEIVIPSREIEVLNQILEHEHTYTGSKIFGSPGLLQNEILKTGKSDFILQLYGGDFPDEFQDIFYLSDAVGYLFMGENGESIFFVQVT